MGESNLKTLISSMEPLLNPGEYVYVTLDPSQTSTPTTVTRLLSELALGTQARSSSSSASPGTGNTTTTTSAATAASPTNTNVVGIFSESEGLTFILDRNFADSLYLPYDPSFIASWITLRVHSSLNAVGLTAAVAGALMTAGISCNVVAGYYHDHLFVSVGDGAKAVEVLKELSKK